MRIIIEPTELVAASETLRTCSIEAADIGSGLWACAQCAMPADLHGVVDQLLSAVDRALDSVGTQLLVQALDLTRRALIAVNDSQMATMSVNNSTPGADEGWAPFDTMMIGEATSATALTADWTDAMIGSTVVGGSSFDSAGLTADWTDAMIGSTAVGNSFDAGALTGSWADSMVRGSAVGGTPTYAGGSMSAVMMLAGFVERGTAANQAAINAIVSNPASSALALRVAMDTQSSIGANFDHQLSPSRSDLDADAGYHLTDNDVLRISPETLTSPSSPISA